MHTEHFSFCRIFAAFFSAVHRMVDTFSRPSACHQNTDSCQQSSAFRKFHKRGSPDGATNDSYRRHHAPRQTERREEQGPAAPARNSPAIKSHSFPAHTQAVMAFLRTEAATSGYSLEYDLGWKVCFAGCVEVFGSLAGIPRLLAWCQNGDVTVGERSVGVQHDGVHQLVDISYLQACVHLSAPAAGSVQLVGHHLIPHG